MEDSIQENRIKTYLHIKLRSIISKRFSSVKSFSNDTDHENIIWRFYKLLNKEDEKTGLIHIYTKSHELKFLVEDSVELLLRELEIKNLRIKTLGIKQPNSLIYSLKTDLKDMINDSLAQVYLINLSNIVFDSFNSDLLRKLCEKSYQNDALIILLSPYKFEFINPHLGFLTYLHHNYGKTKQKVEVINSSESPIHRQSRNLTQNTQVTQVNYN